MTLQDLIHCFEPDDVLNMIEPVLVDAAVAKQLLEGGD